MTKTFATLTAALAITATLAATAPEANAWITLDSVQVQGGNNVSGLGLGGSRVSAGGLGAGSGR